MTSTIALIGLGHIAEHQLAALALSPQWSLAGACDVRPDRRALLPNGVPFFENIENLLRDCPADLYMVATPNVTHYAIGRQVLEAGRNLLLEKPCTETPAQMAELVGLAETKGLFFGVAMHAMFANDLAWYLGACDDRSWAVEHATSFEAEFYDPLVEHGVCQPGAASLGDSWFDSAINALSVVTSLRSGEPLVVESAQFLNHGVAGVRAAEACVWLRSHSGRLTGLVRTNWTLGLNRKTTRIALNERREVLLHHSYESVIFLENGREVERKDLRNGRPRLVNHYVNLFADARHGFASGRSNLDLAKRLHGLLFDAIERASDA